MKKTKQNKIEDTHQVPPIILALGVERDLHSLVRGGVGMEVEDQVCLTYKANKEYIHIRHIRHTYKEVSVWKQRTTEVCRIFSREYATCSGCSGTFAGNRWKSL